jgi:shikimate dehydrogenase
MSEAATPKIAGVFGFPIAHSLSPLLHGYWINEHKLAAHYLAFEVRPEHMEKALRALPALGLAGCNLTIPHKEQALTMMDEIDEAARNIGAINTVIVRPDGALLGRNTDALGFGASIAHLLKPDDKNRRAVILGAGGAARAVLAALVELGWREVAIVNRNLARAQGLAEHWQKPPAIQITAHDWLRWSKAIEDASLIVNATSLGMIGQPALELSLANAPQSALAVDIVYRPLMTPFLLEAKARGLRTADGLGMLMHQARPAFRAWFGIDPAVTPELRRTLEQALGES